MTLQLFKGARHANVSFINYKPYYIQKKFKKNFKKKMFKVSLKLIVLSKKNSKKNSKKKLCFECLFAFRKNQTVNQKENP